MHNAYKHFLTLAPLHSFQRLDVLSILPLLHTIVIIAIQESSYSCRANLGGEASQQGLGSLRYDASCTAWLDCYLRIQSKKLHCIEGNQYLYLHWNHHLVAHPHWHCSQTQVAQHLEPEDYRIQCTQVNEWGVWHRCNVSTFKGSSSHSSLSDCSSVCSFSCSTDSSSVCLFL